MEMTEDQFWHHFHPVKNHLDDNAAHEGCMFETYGAEIDFVRSQEPNKVWTIVEGDNDTMFFCKGFHLVNRLGFFVTEVPWTDEDGDVQCDMKGEEEPTPFEE
jgi:hypothetical protein